MLLFFSRAADSMSCVLEENFFFFFCVHLPHSPRAFDVEVSLFSPGPSPPFLGFEVAILQDLSGLLHAKLTGHGFGGCPSPPELRCSYSVSLLTQTFLLKAESLFPSRWVLFVLFPCGGFPPPPPLRVGYQTGPFFKLGPPFYIC